MPSFGVNLCKDQILLTSSSSGQGISVIGNDYSFGQVEQTWDWGGIFAVGDTVLFKVEDSVQLVFENVTYFLLDQDKIRLTEA